MNFGNILDSLRWRNETQLEWDINPLATNKVVWQPYEFDDKTIGKAHSTMINSAMGFPYVFLDEGNTINWDSDRCNSGQSAINIQVWQPTDECGGKRPLTQVLELVRYLTHESEGWGFKRLTRLTNMPEILVTRVYVDAVMPAQYKATNSIFANIRYVVNVTKNVSQEIEDYTG